VGGSRRIGNGAGQRGEVGAQQRVFAGASRDQAMNITTKIARKGDRHGVGSVVIRRLVDRDGLPAVRVVECADRKGRGRNARTPKFAVELKLTSVFWKSTLSGIMRGPSAPDGKAAPQASCAHNSSWIALVATCTPSLVVNLAGTHYPELSFFSNVIPTISASTNGAVSSAGNSVHFLPSGACAGTSAISSKAE